MNQSLEMRQYGSSIEMMMKELAEMMIILEN